MMRLSSYEDDWQYSYRLCWEYRLLHMASTVRYTGNIDLKLLCDSITNPKDHRLPQLGHLFKHTVSEPDVPVQDKALDALIAYLKAADADVAVRYAQEICDALVANCFTDRPETLTKAQIVFMLWVELGAVNAVLDAMEKSIKTQVAKAVLPAIDVMFQALSEFGTTIVPPDRLLKILLELYDHRDQKVCASSKRLTLELYRWIGRDPVKSILFEKMSDTMKKELDAELPNVTVASIPSRKIKCEQVKEPEQQVATDATRSGPSEEAAAEFPLEKDEYKLVDVDPDDILKPLAKSGFWNKVKSGKCTLRKEALAKLTKLASTKRITHGDFTDLCRILEKLVTDRNIFVRIEAVRAIGNLALGLGISFHSYSHNFLRVLLASLREKKAVMTEALTNTLQSIHKAGCITLANILTDVEVAVKSEDPHVRSGTLNWVKFCIASSNKVDVCEVYKGYAQICLESLDDGTAGVREAAFSVLVAIGKSVGMKRLSMSLEKLDYFRHRKLSEMNGVSLDSAPTVARHGIMKRESSRRRRIAEPYEMTQLKSAAWKEPLKVTNQLQNMSLSDSQEQNKKQKQHYDDTYSEEEIESMIAQAKWVISHTCTKCGIFYGVSCYCESEFSSMYDMDCSFSIYGAAETLKDGPLPVWCPPDF